MIPRFLYGLLLLNLACSPGSSDRLKNNSGPEGVFLWSAGVAQQIKDPTLAARISNEAVRLISEADDIYWKTIAESDIQEFRRSGCIEVVFAKTRKIVIQAVKETRNISKLLIPLASPWCSHDAHIIFGDPEYDSFNLLLNSQGCDSLKNILSNAGLS